MSRRFWLVADDYGLSPAVSTGIRQLIAAGRLSGTGCMTLFPEWRDEAARLKNCLGVEQAYVGQHLTLTDFPGLTGFSLDGSGRMPALKDLILSIQRSRRHDEAIMAELDAQLAAFISAWGAPPAYLDGHQHVHFLRPVRRWLATRSDVLSREGRLPWLRAAPVLGAAQGAVLKAKVAFVALLAWGFDKEMRLAGFPLKGPLAGFYAWQEPERFQPSLDRWIDTLADGTLLMCHPGEVDDTLRARDGLVEARAVELKALLEREPICLRAGTS